MKSSTILLLAVLAFVTTWAACTAGVPMVPPFGAAGTGAPGNAEDGLEEGLLDLTALGPDAPPLPADAERERGMEALRRGLSAAADGRSAEALREFENARRTMPAFAGWARLLSARAVAESGDTEAVERQLEGVRDAGAAAWAWRARHAVRIAAGDSAGAIRIAESAAPELEMPGERALAWSWVGEGRAAGGDWSGALAAFRLAMAEGTQSQGALAAARGAHDLPNLTPADRLLVGRTLLAHGGIDRGIPMLDAYASSPGVDAAEATKVRLDAGRLLFNARRYDDAEEQLRVAAPSSPEALYLLGRTLYRQGRQDQGIQRFLEVAQRFPTENAAADALFLLGDLAHDDGRVSAAGEYYRQAVASGAHSAAAADAAVRLAGISILAGRPQNALADLNRYFAARPRDVRSAPALYWLGRAQLESGDATAAAESFQTVLSLDPVSYYGMLAAGRLDTSIGALALQAPPADDEDTLRGVELAFFRIDALAELGLQEEADLELARLQETADSNIPVLYSVAEAMSRHGQPIAGALLGRTIQQRRGEWDDRLLRIVFQFPYLELVVREADRHSLDPFVIAGLIRQESFFNANAVSPVGAVGLMQVMPTTGTGLARRAGISNFSAASLRDPETNVRLGTLFLADQMERWNGRLSDVFSAYNAGPNRVARWRQYPEHRDDEIYVERIPIAETRDYVKRLRLNEEIYRRLYASDR